MTGTSTRAPAVTRLRSAAIMMGPAFVVAVAYVDPGNFATNMAGGAAHGYVLLWVIVSASLLAMFIQYQSAKLGIVTGRNLPQLCRAHCSRPVTGLLWVQAELVTMATDLAEFVGAAVALNLLFGIPLVPAAIITAVVSAGILMLQPLRRRRFQSVIIGLLAIVLGGFLYQTLQLGPLTGAAGGLVPGFAGADSVLLATGMLGATVMPHVIYLHSALTQHHHRPELAAQKRALRTSKADITVALTIAGAVNVSMLVVAAGTFHTGTSAAPQSLEQMHSGLGDLLGPGAALAFALALLASGLAASSVGTYSGQVVMEGFLRRRIPLVVRRLVTMAPALAILSMGVDPTEALVISQVVLSFGIPFALVPLVLLGRRKDVMGEQVNKPAVTTVGMVAAAVVSTLNLFLLAQTLLG
ncbi:Nramp family divalent metal transporter [Kibdelosporangium phytohabitans]|uniref:Manganese transport protein MntH n=1 Tax=Kibdelosporangium phytohabitans TaxID=860235 RepID=A0A0N9I7L4_9PSEU|nr:Nramp family divalent metal transporter [Kibdelosporangium phytohabitans]ALG10493.1 manganese transport protein MntH [Kibdelosporangium phytohabitans]MBE1461583.1 manganese transport protein [Kibdelosporangium phytohabitans]